MSLVATHTQATPVITRYFRVFCIFVHTLLGLVIAALIFPLLNSSIKARLIQWWCGRLLAAFNLRVKIVGNPPHYSHKFSNNMLIANHVSWADIHALNSVLPLRFIAKSEIKHWPIFGYLVRCANTLFIDRNKKHEAKRTAEVVTACLLTGDNIGLFPEGTTTDGTVLKPFKSSLIQAAIEAKSMIWPVAIRYIKENGEINTAPAYAGETTLIDSMQQILRQKQPVIELHFLQAITAASFNDRRTLTLHIEGEIRQKLGL
ncbi:MAG: 1-acyl-sn-glycerol-3-phosphate acyltransferase [Methylotenera sp.]|nr:1-acyl-sn-glycerol-3-phosphate acyltransferase [Methylotenera sp.]